MPTWFLIRSRKISILLLVVELIVGIEGSRLNLVGNGYEDVVVAIDPSVTEETTSSLIAAIKVTINETSHVLFTATNDRAYFRKVYILIPDSWKSTPAEEAPLTLTKQDYDFWVVPKKDGQGNEPSTLQPGGCGDPGEYIYAPPEFFTKKPWGSRGKTLVNEWAKYRWGVFDEQGYPEDPQYPIFYIDSIGKVQPNYCTNSPLVGTTVYSETNFSCINNPFTGLPLDTCRFVPDLSASSPPTSSLMSLDFLPSIIKFCNSSTHNSEAKTKQNAKCNGLSIWDVMVEHEDFAFYNNPPTTLQPDPEFKVVKLSKPSYCIVIDQSASMDEVRGFERTKRALDTWIRYEVGTGSRVAIVSYNTGAEVLHPLTEILDGTSRTSLVNSLSLTTSEVGSCTICGLQKAVEVLAGKANSVIILIHAGIEERATLEAVEFITSHDNRVNIIYLGYDFENDYLNALRGSPKNQLFIVPIDDIGPIYDDALRSSLASEEKDSLAIKIVSDVQDIRNGLKNSGSFLIDSSLTNNLRVTIQTNDPEANSGFEKLVGPNGEPPGMTLSKHMKAIHFIVPKAEEGIWSWELEYKTAIPKPKLSVEVYAAPTDPAIPPISVKNWAVETTPEDETDQKFYFFSEVKQGNFPVIEALANVILKTSDNMLTVQRQLLDDGLNADVIKDDGIYSAVIDFEDFPVNGEYSTVFTVEGNSGTKTVKRSILNLRNKVGKRNMDTFNRRDKSPQEYYLDMGHSFSSSPSGRFKRQGSGSNTTTTQISSSTSNATTGSDTTTTSSVVTTTLPVQTTTAAPDTTTVKKGGFGNILPNLQGNPATANVTTTDSTVASNLTTSAGTTTTGTGTTSTGTGTTTTGTETTTTGTGTTTTGTGTTTTGTGTTTTGTGTTTTGTGTTTTGTGTTTTGTDSMTTPTGVTTTAAGATTTGISATTAGTGTTTIGTNATTTATGTTTTAAGATTAATSATTTVTGATTTGTGTTTTGTSATTTGTGATTTVVGSTTISSGVTTTGASPTTAVTGATTTVTGGNTTVAGATTAVTGATTTVTGATTTVTGATTTVTGSTTTGTGTTTTGTGATTTVVGSTTISPVVTTTVTGVTTTGTSPTIAVTGATTAVTGATTTLTGATTTVTGSTATGTGTTTTGTGTTTTGTDSTTTVTGTTTNGTGSTTTVTSTTTTGTDSTTTSTGATTTTTGTDSTTTAISSTTTGTGSTTTGTGSTTTGTGSTTTGTGSTTTGTTITQGVSTSTPGPVTTTPFSISSLKTDNDTIPPAAITNVQATAISSTGLNITWTATGDDGTIGKATAYEILININQSDVQCSNQSNCSPNAIAVSYLTSYGVQSMNKTSGQPISVVYNFPSDFLNNVSYYVTVIPLDDSGNYGALSNVASFVYTAPPATTPTPAVDNYTYFVGTVWPVLSTILQYSLSVVYDLLYGVVVGSTAGVFALAGFAMYIGIFKDGDLEQGLPNRNATFVGDISGLLNLKNPPQYYYPEENAPVTRRVFSPKNNKEENLSDIEGVKCIQGVTADETIFVWSPFQGFDYDGNILT